MFIKVVDTLVKLDFYKAFALGQVLCCLEKYGRMYSRRPLSALKQSIIIIMINISINIKLDERPDSEYRVAHKPIFVRGYFRTVKGKRVYVKAHYRKR